MSRRELAVVAGYQGLIAAVRARKQDLRMSDMDLEDIAGLTRGHVSKLLTRGASKVLGPLSMGRLLRALGLELVVSENTEQTAKIRELFTERDDRRVSKRALMGFALSEPPTWLLTPEKARHIRANQLARTSKTARSRIAKKAWRTRRRREQEARRSV